MSGEYQVSDDRRGEAPGCWLRRQRTAAGLTQEELAERSGLSVRAISDLERGRTHKPYPASVRRLAHALGLSGEAGDLLVARYRSDCAPGPLPAGEQRQPAHVPRQLPAAVRHFVGRGAEQRALDALLGQVGVGAGTVVISAVDGTAGVGKTALAVHWAHRVADRFPDGHLYVNLRGFDPAGALVEPAEAIRRFLEALDVPAQRIPADLDAQAALYRTLLAGRRMLIVLDNARDAAQVRPLLPGSSGSLVLVTSRHRLTPLVATENAHSLTLRLLTRDEAQDLIVRRLGRDRVGAEPDAVTTITERCGRLPLALAIAAAYAAAQPDRPLAGLAEELAGGGGTTLDRLSAGDASTDVRSVFSWSYRALTPDAARLFRLFGLHPGPDVAAPAVASLAGLPRDRARSLLAELVRANLVTEQADGRYSLHDLLWAYAADLARTVDSGAQRQAATHRLLDHYLHTARAAGQVLNPAREPIAAERPGAGVTPEQLDDQPQAVAWFTAEQAVLLSIVNHAAATGFDAHTQHLAWALATFLDRQGHWRDWVGVGHAALTAAQRLGDQSAQARAHTTLFAAYFRLGLVEDAHTQLRQALDLYRAAGDRIAQAHTHYNLAHVAGQRRQLDEALDHGRQALDLFAAAGHRIGQANTLNVIGWCYSQSADFQQSLVHCRQALALEQELDDAVGLACTWDSLGYANHHLGHYGEAIACYQRAIALYREIGDRYPEATTLTWLGDTHDATGDRDAAGDAWRRALAILDDLDHPDAGPVRTRLSAGVTAGNTR